MSSLLAFFCGSMLSGIAAALYAYHAERQNAIRTANACKRAYNQGFNDAKNYEHQ